MSSGMPHLRQREGQEGCRGDGEYPAPSLQQVHRWRIAYVVGHASRQ